MKSSFFVACLSLFVSTGCTTASLERRSVNQALSISGLRYQMVLDNFAHLAAEPCSLPSIAIVGDGSTQISDTRSFESKTAWDHLTGGFAKEMLSPGMKRSPDQTWTLDPVANPDALKALQAAFRWVLFGEPEPGSEALAALDVYQRTTEMHKLPQNWLHVGERGDVPNDACYRSHCCSKWVWVCAKDMEGLSQFVLIVLDICTVDPTSLGGAQASCEFKPDHPVCPQDEKPENSSKPERVNSYTENRKVTFDKNCNYVIARSNSALCGPICPSVKAPSATFMDQPQEVETELPKERVPTNAADLRALKDRLLPRP